MKPRKDVEIFLHVKAKALFEGGTIEDNCEFSDDNEGKPVKKPKDFKTEIFFGKFVTWEIKLNGPEIKKFKVKKIIIYIIESESPFKTNPVESLNFKLKEQIKDTTTIIDFKYEFKFELEFDNKSKLYSIDPKLRINPNPIDG